MLILAWSGVGDRGLGFVDAMGGRQLCTSLSLIRQSYHGSGERPSHLIIHALIPSRDALAMIQKAQCSL